MLWAFLKKNGMAALFALCFALSWPGCFAAQAAPGPEETIPLLQQGIDTKNLALVEKHLDIDGVVAKGLEQLLADPEVVTEVAKNPAVAVMLALGGEEANAALHTLLLTETREYITHGVVSGAFAGTPDKTAAPYRGLFRKAFKGGEKDKKVFGPAKVSQREKNASLVTTTLADGTKGRVYPLTLRLQRQAGVWRVVELRNLPEFINAAKRK